MTINPKILVCAAVFFSMTGNCNTLQVTTWGGEHAIAISKELLLPYSRDVGVAIEQKGIEDVVAGAASADVIEIGLHDAVEACDSGELLLLPLDGFSEPMAKKRIIGDFVPNTLQPCSIGHSLWSTVVVFNQHLFTDDERPVHITDFFNTDYYPGKRVLRKSPRALAEWALIAGGVKASEIYQVLDNTDLAWGIIEKGLREIENEIVWVDSDAEAIEFVRAGHAAFAMAGSQTVIRDAVENGPDEIAILWDAALTEVAMWAIPRDAPNPRDSLRFLNYAASVTNSGKIASVFGYGPARYSSLKRMDRNFQVLLPSWPDNQTNIVWASSRWWRDSGEDLNILFAQWIVDFKSNRSLTLATP